MRKEEKGIIRFISSIGWIIPRGILIQKTGLFYKLDFNKNNYSNFHSIISIVIFISKKIIF